MSIPQTTFHLWYGYLKLSHLSKLVSVISQKTDMLQRKKKYIMPFGLSIFKKFPVAQNILWWLMVILPTTHSITFKQKKPSLLVMWFTIITHRHTYTYVWKNIYKEFLTHPHSEKNIYIYKLCFTHTST